MIIMMLITCWWCSWLFSWFIFSFLSFIASDILNIIRLLIQKEEHRLDRLASLTMTPLRLLARSRLHNTKRPVQRQLLTSGAWSVSCSHGFHFDDSERKYFQSLSSNGIQCCRSVNGIRASGGHDLNNTNTKAQLFLLRTSTLALDSTPSFWSSDVLRLVSGHRFFSSKTTGGGKNLSASTPLDITENESFYKSKIEKSGEEKKPHLSKPTSSLAKTTNMDKKEDSIMKKATDATLWAVKSIVSMLAKTPGVLWFYITHPKDFRNKLAELKEAAVKEAHHYWVGSKVSFSRQRISNTLRITV